MNFCNINKMMLVARLPNIQNAWPDDATLTLIRLRRQYQHQFSTSRVHDQHVYWEEICQHVTNQHPNFAPTMTQCRTKWKSLKSGYENLSRLMDGNAQRYPTHTPSMHDEQFHEELLDEFWTIERKYFYFYLIYLMYLYYIFIFFVNFFFFFLHSF